MIKETQIEEGLIGKLSDILYKYFYTHPFQYCFMEIQYDGPYSAISIQALFHRALEKAQFEAYALVYMLRHSYAAN